MMLSEKEKLEEAIRCIKNLNLGKNTSDKALDILNDALLINKYAYTITAFSVPRFYCPCCGKDYPFKNISHFNEWRCNMCLSNYKVISISENSAKVVFTGRG